MKSFSALSPLHKTQNNATSKSCSKTVIKSTHTHGNCSLHSHFSSFKLTHSKHTAMVGWSNIPIRISFQNIFCHFYYLLQLWTISCTQTLGSIFYERNCILHSRKYSMLRDM